MSTIQLRSGDMFAQPTDLIIIPCSTAATITSAVAAKLKLFDITPPRKIMNLGDVEFKLFEGAASLATYVGYAASVAAMESSADAVTAIAKKVALFANEKSEIRDVSLPLLGSGAGGLSLNKSLEALLSGLMQFPNADKVYNIFVYDEDDFARLKEEIPRAPTNERLIANYVRQNSHRPLPPQEKTREAIRVFISYTRTSAEHQEWVRDLAKFLRDNGIDARLDVWHLRPGMDLPQWMSNEIDLADRILIICNEDYATRANGRLGGVGWEIKLVQGDLLQTQQSNPKKYLPIVRGSLKKESVPAFLRGVYSISWPEKNDHNERRNLLVELYEAYEEAPPLGSPPRFVIR